MQAELFHRISEPGSARVRKLVVDRALQPLIRFRNVVYPEAMAALASHGGAETPALWDGERFFTGEAAVTGRLLELLAGLPG
jgi:hypothetical protein